MSAFKLPNVTPAKLRAAFKTDLAECWRFAQKNHPDHTPYAFVLYGVEGGASFSPHVLTEESLTQVAARYLKTGPADTLEESRKSLRYSVPDSPHFEELADQLVTVNELLQPHEKALQDDEVAGYELLAKAAMGALQQLDQEEFFGGEKERGRLLLLIITEDMEKDWCRATVKKLNPPVAFQKFEADTRVEGEYKASEFLTLSPDGQTLYATGSRNLPLKKPEQSVSEIVAYNLAGLRLKGRWQFTFPSFGDSGRAIACAPDGRTVLLMRAKYTGSVSQTLLMRFGSHSDQPVEQGQIAGEPTCFAVAADGLRMAVGLHDESLHLLDQKFILLNRIELGVKPRGACFLRYGELLIGTDKGLMRLNNQLKLSSTPCQNPVAGISVDANEKLLAVSCAMYQSPPTQRRGEFGIHLLRLPTLELERTILIPGHQSTNAVISRDGKFVAFDGGMIGTFRHYAIVCDAGTGREIGRRKVQYINDLQFTADNRALLIAKSEITPKEPIDVWPFIASDH